MRIALTYIYVYDLTATVINYSLLILQPINPTDIKHPNKAKFIYQGKVGYAVSPCTSADAIASMPVWFF